MNINLSDLLKNANARAAEAAHTARTCPPPAHPPFPPRPVPSEAAATPDAAPAEKAGKKKKNTGNKRRPNRVDIFLDDLEFQLLQTGAAAAGMSRAEYARQSIREQTLSKRRTEDQRTASLAMMGQLRSELTRCRTVLQRREGKDQELIDIMLSIHRMIAIIDAREEELST